MASFFDFENIKGKNSVVYINCQNKTKTQISLFPLLIHVQQFNDGYAVSRVVTYLGEKHVRGRNPAVF